MGSTRVGPRFAAAAVGLLVVLAGAVPPAQAIDPGSAPTATPSPTGPVPTAAPGGRQRVAPLTAGMAIMLPAAGSVTATILSSSAADASDLGLDQPTHELLLVNATGHVGTTLPVGTFAADTSLVFYIYDENTAATYLSTSNHAEVNANSADSWTINWEDGTDFDYNDLVTQITLIPTVGSPPVAQSFGTGSGDWGGDYVARHAEPVNTATGNYESQVTDLSMRGRGIDFAFTRTYNSLDPSVGPFGVGWSFSYGAHLAIDASGDATFSADDGAQYVFAADGAGGFVTPPGSTAQLASETDGYVLTRHDGRAYHFSSAGALLSDNDRNGNTISLTYNGASELSAISDTVGRVVTLTHDAAGHLTGLADPLGRTVTYGYDATGELVSVTDVRGGTTQYTYDAAGRLATIVDQNGHTLVTNTYDPTSGRVTAQEDALGDTTTFAWDEATTTSTMTDALGNLWTDVYANGLLASTSDPLGDTTSYSYDDAFERTSATDPDGHTTSYSYDARGNLLSRTAPAPLSYVETYTYDDANDLLSDTDGRGNTTSYSYDAAGNLTETSYPDGSATSATYDAHGLRLTATDERGKVTSFAYDTAGNLVSKTSPLGEVTTMSYDAVGRLLTEVDPRGNVTGADPGQYTTSYTYDAADDLIEVTDPLGHTTATTYDAAGNRTGVTDPDNHSTAYGYDAANHLTSVTDALSHTTSYVYDAVGNLLRRTDPNGHVATYAYDVAGHVTAQTDADENDWSFAYDAAGNLLSRTDANGMITTYTYDALNRVTGVDYSDGSTPSVTYAYDANGNRTSMGDGAGQETFTYDARSRPTADVRAGNEFSYTYDAAGNILSRMYPDGTVTSYTYDDDGRLASATFPSDSGVPDTSAPSVPGDLTASPVSASEIDLTWSAATDNVGVAGYKLYRDGTYLASLGLIGSTSISDTGLDPDTSYTYHVSAIDAAGNASDQSQPASATTLTAIGSSEMRVSVAPGQVNGLLPSYRNVTPVPATADTYADTSAYATSVLADNPVAYWRLGEAAGPTALDETGSHDATYVGAPTYGITGALADDPDTAVSLTGLTDYATAPDAAAFDVGDGPFSVEAWVRWSDNGVNTSDWFVGKWASGVGWAIGIDVSGVLVGYDAGGYWYISAEQISPGVWHHLVITKDGSARTAYCDGVLLTNTASNVTLTTNSNPVGIGAAGASTSNSLNGDLDEVAFYDTVLSATRVAAHYAAGTSGVGDTEPPAVPTDVVATANAPDDVDLTWSASSDNVGVSRYTIYRDGTQVAVVDGAVTSFSDRTTLASTTYSYTVSASDAAGNTSAASQPASATTPAPAGPVTATYTYDPAGDLLTAATPDGVTARYTYDHAGRLLEVANTEDAGTLSRFTYGLDPAGNRTELTTLTGTTYYSYDAAGRLTDACTGGACVPAGAAPLACLACPGDALPRPDVSISPDPADTETAFTYDPVGNRLSLTTSLGTTAYAYDAADRLTSVTAPDEQVTTYTYDANGNQRSAGDASYTYNAADEMTAATVGTLHETYTWSGDGIRLSASDGSGSVTQFLVDRTFAQPMLALTADANGAVTGDVVYGAARLALLDASGATYEHHDGLGSVSDLTDPAGASLAWTEYAPYGSVRAAGAVAGAPADPFGFTGEYTDPTGLIYLRARQYDPTTGRFVAPEQAGVMLSDPAVGPYVYVADGPLNAVDPSGLCAAPSAPVNHARSFMPSPRGRLFGCEVGKLGLGLGMIFAGSLLEVGSSLLALVSAGTMTPEAAVGIMVGVVDISAGQALVLEACRVQASSRLR